MGSEVNPPKAHPRILPKTFVTKKDTPFSRIENAEALTTNWQNVLKHKFSATELDKARAEFEALLDCTDPETHSYD